LIHIYCLSIIIIILAKIITMNKTLQWLLGITLLGNGFILLYSLIGISIFSWNSDQPAKEVKEGVVYWKYEYKISLKDYALGKEYKLDSLSKKTLITNYINLKSAKPVYSENAESFILKDQQKLSLGNIAQQDGIRIPLSESQYLGFKTLNILVLIIALVLLSFFTLILFRFNKEVGKGDFFITANIKRLKWLGMLIIVSFFSFHMLNWCIRLFITKSLLITGIQYNQSFSLFPFELIIGLMLLVIATAFEKGKELKEDQQLTI